MAEAQRARPAGLPALQCLLHAQAAPGARPPATDPAAWSRRPTAASARPAHRGRPHLPGQGPVLHRRRTAGGDEAAAAPYRDGCFATIYLSPRDYHRVHMPLDGKLRETAPRARAHLQRGAVRGGGHPAPVRAQRAPGLPFPGRARAVRGGDGRRDPGFHRCHGVGRPGDPALCLIDPTRNVRGQRHHAWRASPRWRASTWAPR